MSINYQKLVNLTDWIGLSEYALTTIDKKYKQNLRIRLIKTRFVNQLNIISKQD